MLTRTQRLRPFQIRKFHCGRLLASPHPHSPIHEVTIKNPNRISLCRCWKSQKMPYCDGSHKEHNKHTGQNLGPVRVFISSKISESGQNCVHGPEFRQFLKSVWEQYDKNKNGQLCSAELVEMFDFGNSVASYTVAQWIRETLNQTNSEGIQFEQFVDLVVDLNLKEVLEARYKTEIKE